MTQSEENFARIEEHRAQIDAIDQKLVALLNERATHSLAIRELKPGAHMGLFDARREEEIFEKIQAYNDGPLYDDNLREIYAALLKVMKEVPA